MISRIIEYISRLVALDYRRGVVVACVGTDAVIADSLGAICGQMLRERQVNAYVYGCLSRPITAKNLGIYAEFIGRRHADCVVIAVDSCVGFDVGGISVSLSPLKPAAALGKDLPPIGDISITATTSNYLPFEREYLSCRLSLVHSLAQKISDNLTTALNTLYYKTPQI